MKELRRTANAVNVLTIKESHMTSTAVWTLTVTQGMRQFQLMAIASDAHPTRSAQETERLVSKPHVDLMNTDPKMAIAPVTVELVDDFLRP